MARDQTASHSSTAMILDPRFNLQVFDLCWPGSVGNEKRRRRAEAAFQQCHDTYRHRVDEIEVTLPSLNSRR